MENHPTLAKGSRRDILNRLSRRLSQFFIGKKTVSSDCHKPSIDYAKEGARTEFRGILRNWGQARAIPGLAGGRTCVGYFYSL